MSLKIRHSKASVGFCKTIDKNLICEAYVLALVLSIGFWIFEIDQILFILTQNNLIKSKQISTWRVLEGLYVVNQPARATRLQFNIHNCILKMYFVRSNV